MLSFIQNLINCGNEQEKIARVNTAILIAEGKASFAGMKVPRNLG